MPRRTSMLLPILLVALSSAPVVLAQDAAPPAAEAAEGRVIRGAVNVFGFRPESNLVRVDAETVDLRAVFEDLGPDAIEWYQHVQTLANPWFEGRAPGSPGHERAIEYLEWWMARIGLEPAFPPASEASVGPSYRQPFTLSGREPRVEGAIVALPDRVFVRDRDYAVTGISGTGAVAAPLAFVGYGIKEGPDGYTSFGDPEVVRGRIAMLLRYEPLDDEGRSRWGGTRFSAHSSIAEKLAHLESLGVAGVVLVNPPGAAGGRTGLEDLRSSRWGSKRSMPVVQVTPETFEAILAAADPQKRSLDTLRRASDRGELRAFALDERVRLDLETRVGEATVAAANIGGILRGRGALAEEFLIVGGHFDHVGFGLFGADPANRGRLHPGADDNASGTAALLVLARRMKDAYDAAPRDAELRSVLFVLFDAEESGLDGSRHFVRTPILAADAISAMINLDMVGRLRGDELTVGGVGTAEGFDARLEPHFVASGLTVRADPSGRGPSDHANFYNAGVPVLFFFTGVHESYHRPEDEAHTVHPAGAMRVLDLVHAVAEELASGERLRFTSTDSVPTRDRGYAPVRFGVMPGMGERDEPGLLVEAVSAETSAAVAGIKPGDVILKWNDIEINGAGDLVARMREHQPGDVVAILLRRDGKEETVQVTLKASQPRE